MKDTKIETRWTREFARIDDYNCATFDKIFM
jgi:hypothetical protein